MAWKDPVQEQQLATARGPVPRQGINLDAVRDVLDAGQDERSGLRAEGAASLQQMSSSSPRSMAAAEPAEFAFNPSTKKWAFQGPDGEFRELDQTPANLFALSDLDVQPMTSVPRGYQPISKSELQNTLAGVAEESDFLGNLGSSFLTTIGLAASALDAEFGNDDPDNWLSRASERNTDSQSLGQYKASRAPWFSSLPAFRSELGTALGNVAGVATGAIPGAIVGAVAGTAGAPGPGTIAGAVTGAGLGVMGGLSAYGDQSTGFYAAAFDELSQMAPEQAVTESPLYAELLYTMPGADHETLSREVAIRGSRAAGRTASLLGAAESVVGGKLAGNLLRRMRPSSALGSRLGGEITDRAPVSRGKSFAKALGKAGVGGGVSGGTESLESGFGQAAGAMATGIGDTDPTAHMSREEFYAASLPGVLFGGLGGRSYRAAAPAAGDLGAAMDNADVASTAAPEQDQFQGPASMPEPSSPPNWEAGESDMQPPGPGDVRPNANRALPMDVIEGEFAEVPQYPALPAPPRRRMDEINRQESAFATQEEALDAFVQFTGLTSPEAVDANWEQLMELADANPNIRDMMQAAGILDPQIEMSPDTAGNEWLRSMPPDNTTARVPVPTPVQPDGRAQAAARGPITAQRAAVQNAPVGTPEPVAAPAERTADGRPVGVAPDPVQGATPVPAGQLEQAAASAQQRAVRTGVPAADVAAAVQASEQQVVPSTPEPAEDLTAQLQDMADPEAGRTAVFVAEGNEAQIPQDAVPPDALTVSRKGRGTLITFDPEDATKFRRGKWTDADNARVLGYSEDKASALSAGQDPVVVEAITPEGAVAAQQIAAPANARAAAAAVKKQARRSAAVVAKTPERAQAERTARTAERPAPATAPDAVVPTNRKVGPKAAKAVDAAKARSKKKSPQAVQLALNERGLAVATDKENAPSRLEAEAPAVTRADRAQAQAAPAAKPAQGKTLDIAQAAAIPARTIHVKDDKFSLPASIATTLGEGGAVDLRVYTVDEALRAQLQGLQKQPLTRSDAAAVESALLRMDQLDTLLDADVARAEAALRERAARSVDGEAAVAVAEQEAKAAPKRKGKQGRTAESILVHMPLLPEEALDFGRVVRDAAKAEAATPVEPARSNARRLIARLFPGMDGKLGTKVELAQAVRAVSAMTDAELDARITSAGSALRDSALAKQVMRGASAVARVHPQQSAAEATSSRASKSEQATAAEQASEARAAALEPLTAEELGLTEVKGARTTSYEGDGSLPTEAVSVVEGWMAMLERGGIKLGGSLRVMSMSNARDMLPELFPKAQQGRYANFTDADGAMVHVLAVDWDAIASDAYAIEALAHEFGHYVSLEVFNRSDRATQEAVLASYEAWRNANSHRSPLEVWRTHAPALLRTLTPLDTLRMDYASHFNEWSANHVARFLTTRAEPQGVVEKYFARIADLLRKVWRGIAGADQPDAAWAEAIDAWVSGAAARNAQPAHIMDASPMDLDGFAAPGAAEPADPPGRKTAQAILQRSTAGIRAGKGMYDEVFQSVLDGGFKAGASTVNKISDTLYDKMMATKPGAFARRIGLGVMSLDNIEQRFRASPIGKSLSAWVNLQKEKGQLANIVLNGGTFTINGQRVHFPGASRALERANHMSAKARDVLQLAMYYSTHYGVFPDKTWEQNKHLHAEGLSDRVVAANRRRYEHVRNLWTQLGTVDPTHGQAVYTELQTSFSELHSKTLDQQIENIRASTLSERAKEEGIKNLERSRREIKNGPYFPLARFGDWVVRVMQPAEASLHATKAEAVAEHRTQKALNPGAKIRVEKVDGEWAVRTYRYGVYFFESAAEAKAARPQIEADVREQMEVAGVSFDEVKAAVEDGSLSGKGEPMISDPHEKQSVYGDIGNASPFIAELRAAVAAEGIKMDPELARIMETLYIEALPEMSARRSMLPRQNVLGASKQMLQSYAMRYKGAARLFAGTVHGRDVDAAWRELQADARKYEPGGAVVNHLAAHQKVLAERMENTLGNRASNALTDMSSLFSLAFSPAYIMTNAMQPWMITLPVLAGTVDRHGNVVGAVKAQKYLREAYEKALPHFTDRGIAEFVSETRRLFNKASPDGDVLNTSELLISKFGKTDGERAMLRRMLETGRLDFAFLNSIEDALQGDGVGSTLTKVARLGMALPQQVEAMNRVTSALASYRMAMAELGMEHAAASNHAYDVVGATQLDYSRLNRPLLFNKSGWQIVLQFKMYMQGMYALYVQNAYLMLKGKTPAQKKQGRATLMYLLGTHGAIGGTTGLGPLAWTAKLGIGLAAMLMGREDDDDEWKSSEQVLQEKARFLFGDKLADVATNGLPTLVGLDVGDRIGIPSLLDEKFTGIRANDDPGAQMDKWTLFLLGAPYSNVKRATTGIGAALDDDPYTRPSNGLPAGPRAMMRALRVAKEGLVDRDGDVFMSPDKLSWWDVAITATGYQPRATSKAYNTRSEEKKTVAGMRTERNLLLKKWRTADAKGKAALREDIRTYNQSVPTVFQIAPKNLSQSVKAKARRESGVATREEKAVREYLK